MNNVNKEGAVWLRSRNVYMAALMVIAAVVLLVCVSALGADASDAASPDKTGETGECTWELYGTDLYISGDGAMADYTYSNAAPWGKAVTSVTIGDGVTSIGNDAFYYCTSLASVTIPSSVTSIGSYAFCGCTSLASVTIPSSVTSIGDYAFCDCPSLASVTIPSSVTSIGDQAFSSCTSLLSVDIPSSVTSIGDYAFSSCTSLLSVDIPSSVTSIGNGAFLYCPSLASVTIPSSVTSVGNGAFSGCTSLECFSGFYVGITDGVMLVCDGRLVSYAAGSPATSVDIPSSVTSIGGSAFYFCPSLESVTIPSSVTSIGDQAFEGCTSLASVDIPSSVTALSFSAFNSCTSLASVTIPSSVTSIDGYAFSYCTSLASVTIPGSVTSIRDNVFNGCTSLASVDIPSSVTSIGECAFFYCTSLTSVDLTECKAEWRNIFSEVTFYSSDRTTVLEATADNLNGHKFTGSGDGKLYMVEEAPANRMYYEYTLYTVGQTTLEMKYVCKDIKGNVVSSNDAWLTYVVYDGTRYEGSALLGFLEGFVPTAENVVGMTFGRSNDDDGSGSTITLNAAGQYLAGSTNYDSFENFYNSFLNSASYVELYLKDLSGFTMSESDVCLGYADGYSETSVGTSVSRMDFSYYEDYYTVSYVLDGEVVSTDSVSSAYTSYSISSVQYFGSQEYRCVSAVMDGVEVPIGSSFKVTGDVEVTLKKKVTIAYPTETKSDSKALEMIASGDIKPGLRMDSDTLTLVYIEKGDDGYIMERTNSSGTSKTTYSEKSFGGMFLRNTDYTAYASDTLKVERYDGKVGSYAVDLYVMNGYRLVGSYYYLYQDYVVVKYCGTTLSLSGGYSVVKTDSETFNDFVDGKMTLPSTLTEYVYSIDDRYGTPSSGVTGSCTWELRGTELYINGSGAMADYSYLASAPWGTSITSVTIGDGVTSVGPYAFKGCISLASVTIPSSVTSVGACAFYGCRSLASVTIPSSVTSIGSYAFTGCTSLASVDLASVTSIGSGAFTGCTSLASVDLGSVKSIDSNAFSGCTSLTSVDIPSSVTTIGWGVFSGCTSLASFSGTYGGIVNGVMLVCDGRLVSYAAGSSNVSVVIPSTVKSIGDWSFYDCKSLASVTISDTVTSIGAHAFYRCSSLASVDIPSSVTSVGMYAFAECTSLASVEIPSSVVSIGNTAFVGCKSLASVTIPSSVTTLSYGAFNGCTSLASVDLTECKAEWSNIFSGVTFYSSDRTTVLDATAENLNGHKFTGSGDGKLYLVPVCVHCQSTTTTYVPATCTVDGRVDVVTVCDVCGEKTYEEHIVINAHGHIPVADPAVAPTATVSGLTEGSHCSVCHEVLVAQEAVPALFVHPVYVTVVYNDGTSEVLAFEKGSRFSNDRAVFAYYRDSALTTAWAPASKVSRDMTVYASTTVSGEAGEDACWTLDIATGTLTICGEGATYGLSKASAAGWYAYRGVISTVVVEEGVTGIGIRSFYGYSALQEVYLADSVTEVGKYSFQGCSGLEYVSFGSGFATVGYNAFKGTAFTYGSTGIAVSVKDYAGRTFEGCCGTLSTDTASGTSGGCTWEVVFSTGTLTVSGDGATADLSRANDAGWYRFRDAFDTVVVEDGVTGIGTRSFYGYASLREVVLADSVTTVGKYAFQDCPGLEYMSFGSGLATVGYNAFKGTIFTYGSTGITVSEKDLAGKEFSGSGGTLSTDTVTGTAGELSWALSFATGILTVSGNGAVPTYGDASDTPWYAYGESITSLEVRDGVTGIGNKAFYGLDSLTTVVFADSVSVIGKYVFKGCTSLSSVTFGSGLTEVGTGAFDGTVFKDGSKTVTKASALAGNTFEGADRILYRV